MESERRLVYADTVYEMGHRTPFHIGIADLCDLKELLKDVPTVDAVEVVHGRWVTEYWKSGYIKKCSCSECGNHPKDAYSPPNYCDNCGAKMDGNCNGKT